MNAVWAPRLGLRKRREIEKALLLQTGGLELRGTAMLLSLSAARALDQRQGLRCLRRFVEESIGAELKAETLGFDIRVIGEDHFGRRRTRLWSRSVFSTSNPLPVARPMSIMIRSGCSANTSPMAVSASALQPLTSAPAATIAEAGSARRSPSPR